MSLPIFGYNQKGKQDYSHGYKILSYWSFNWVFLWCKWHWTPFNEFIAQSFGNMSVQALVKVLFFLIGLCILICMNLYILDSNLLSDIFVTDIFIQSVACLYILLMLSFDYQKVLVLRGSNLTVLFFMLVEVFFGYLKKSLPITKLQ